MGMLCSAGLATMGEFYDPYGRWDRERIEENIPVAIDVETRREGAFYRAATAAIGSIFGGGTVGKKYSASLRKVMAEVRDEIRAFKGQKPEKRENEDVKTIRKALGGLMPSKRKKGKRK